MTFRIFFLPFTTVLKKNKETKFSIYNKFKRFKIIINQLLSWNEREKKEHDVHVVVEKNSLELITELRFTSKFFFWYRERTSERTSARVSA